MVLLATKLVPWSSTQLCYVIFDVSTHVSNTFSTADRNFCSHHQAHDDLAFSGQEDIAGVLSPFWSYPLKSACVLSHVWLFATPWTAAPQVPLPLGFLKQEYWSRLPLPFPGDLPNPGIKPPSPALQADSLPLSHLGSPYVKSTK